MTERCYPVTVDNALVKLAAECHRAKWQFDFNDENRLPIRQARDTVKRAFDELHRIGDMALNLRGAIKASAPAQAPATADALAAANARIAELEAREWAVEHMWPVETHGEPQTLPTRKVIAKAICCPRGCQRDDDCLSDERREQREAVDTIMSALSRCSEGMVQVPQSALDWLFGERPDPEGKWFGEYADEEAQPDGKIRRKYWWRSIFRSMVPALSRPVLLPHEKTGESQS